MERNSKNKRVNNKKLLIEFGEKVDAAINRAVCQALLEHQRAGNTVAVGRAGKVLLLAPKEHRLKP